ESAVVRFFARDYPRWQKEWEVSLEERLQHSTAKNFERLEPRFEIRPSGERWFDVEMSLASTDGEKFSAADIQRLILSGNSTTRSKKCCAPTNGRAWLGCSSSARTSSVASWRTKWDWAKRSRRWRSSSLATRTASSPARCLSSARPPWFSTGWRKRRSSHPR